MRDRLQDWMRLDHRREAALSLAWGEAECIWHERHGARPEPDHCAGCQALLVGEVAMDLWEGACVHWDDAQGLECLILYGQRWRGAAVAGLAALGLKAPAVDGDSR
jgi:hypothetical protein